MDIFGIWLLTEYSRAQYYNTDRMMYIISLFIDFSVSIGLTLTSSGVEREHSGSNVCLLITINSQGLLS